MTESANHITAARAVLRVITSRKGLRQEFEMIDEDIQAEILEDVERVICEAQEPPELGAGGLQLLKEGIRTRDQRITELEIAASAAFHALKDNNEAEAYLILKHALSPEKP